MDQQKVAVVTGANKGLGRALVRLLCRTYGPNDVVYLTARDEGRGRATLDELAREGQAPRFHRLDLADEGSIAAMAREVRQLHGGIDLLIHNGAYAALPDKSGKEQVRLMIKTNNLGTCRLLEAYRPLLREDARVLVVASGFGTLKSLDPRLHSRFDTGKQTFAELDRVLLDYVDAVEEDRAQVEGFPDWINIASKVGQVAAMRILARELSADSTAPKGILVNAVCPGWMITDASRPYLSSLPKEVTPKQPDEAAPDVLWAGLLPRGTTEPSGELLQYRRVLPWN